MSIRLLRVSFKKRCSGYESISSSSCMTYENLGFRSFKVSLGGLKTVQLMELATTMDEQKQRNPVVFVDT